MIPKLNLLKPNRKNHNLTLLRQDGSALIQQLWEPRLKTLEHLFHDLIDSSGNSKFSNRSEKNVAIGITILSRDLNTTPVYTTNWLTLFLHGKLCFGITKGKNIQSRTLFFITEVSGTTVSYRSTARRMTLNPHAPIFKPTTCSRLFTIYRPELLTEMEASTSQDIIDLTLPTKFPKSSPDFNGPTVSEQLRLLTSQINQLRIDSQQALEQTKPLIQTFPLASIRQFQHLHTVQQQVAQFFVDPNTKKNEGLMMCTTICRLEDELTQLRRQVHEPSSSSLPASWQFTHQALLLFKTRAP